MVRTIGQILVVVYATFLIYVHTKSENNRLNSFRNYLLNKNGYRHQITDNKQMETGDLLFRTHEISRIRKSSDSSDGPYYNTSFAYAQEAEMV